MSLADSLRGSDELNAEEAEELIELFEQHLSLDLALDQAAAFQARRLIDLTEALSSTLDGLAKVCLLLPDSPEAARSRGSLLRIYLGFLGEAYLSTQALHILNYVSRGTHRQAYDRMLSTLREAERRKVDFSLLPYELVTVVSTNRIEEGGSIMSQSENRESERLRREAVERFEHERSRVYDHHVMLTSEQCIQVWDSVKDLKANNAVDASILDEARKDLERALDLPVRYLSDFYDFEVTVSSIRDEDLRCQLLRKLNFLRFDSYQ